LLPSEVSDDIYEDLLFDANDLLHNTFDSVYKTTYPHADVQTSSVLILHHHDDVDEKKLDDSFLQMLQSSYRGTYSRNDAAKSKLRCTMISAGGSAVHVVEFDEEKEYWQFVAGIRKAAHGGYEDEASSGKCQYIESTGAANGKNIKIDESNGKGQNRTVSTGIFGMLSSAVQRDTSGSAGTANNIHQLQHYEITSTTVTVNDSGYGGRCVLSLEITSIKAMALTLDFPTAQELVLEVSLETSKSTVAPSTADHLISSKTTLGAFHLEPLTSSRLGNDTVPTDGTDEVCVVCAVPPEGYEADPLSLLIPMSEEDIRPNSQRFITKNLLGGEDLSAGVIRSVGIFGERLGSPSVVIQPLPLTLFVQRDTPGQAGDRQSSDSYKVDSHLTGLDTTTSPQGLSRVRRSNSSSASFYRPFTRSPSNPSLNSPLTSTLPTGTGDLTVVSSPKKPTLTSLQPVTSQAGGSYVSNSLRFNQPVFSEVQVKQRSLSSRAVRLFVKLAQDIPTSYPKGRGAPLPPTAYCTAYLMGPNSEKLSANTAEARTEAVKSFSPEWNKEILLQDPRVSMEEVTGVMILIRDAASGVLKHHHIGQVTIPISCFLYQTEADFCLPLEPSYR
jgi:hypothetical protein